MAMTKSPKKLTLAQETLRNLNRNKISNPSPGFATAPQTACNCTNNSCVHSVCFGTCIPA